MRFPTIEYMQWAKTILEGDATLSQIGASGVPAPEAEVIGITAPTPLQHPLGDEYGVTSIRERVATLYGLSPEQVYPTEGTSLGNFLALAALLDGGGHAVVETPVYTPLSAQVSALTSDIDWVERPFERGFAIDPERVAAALRPDTRVVVLTNLHNPSGVEIGDAELTAIASSAAKIGAHLLVDEAYRDFLFEDPPGCAARLAPNIVSTGSLTKAGGLGHLRCGWLLGPRDIAHRASRINDYLGVLPPAPTTPLATAALDRRPQLLERARTLLEPSRDVLRAWLDSRADVEVVWPKAGPVTFPRFGRGAIDTEPLVAQLMSEHQTVAVPGRFFRAPWGMRISATASPTDLARGLDKLGKVLDSIVANGGGNRPIYSGGSDGRMI